jgi:hypothetical protein
MVGKVSPMRAWQTAVLTGVVAALASPALAWKPLTHGVQAWKVVEALPVDDPLRTRLTDNLAYLEGGAVGPDVFYALIPAREALLGDVGHYCKTSDLAAAMLSRAGSNPKLEAFALGWLSHNVADSVAHPWVNGFVGAPFTSGLWRSAVAGEVNFEHGHLEAWVNKQYTSQAEQDVFSFALEQVARDPDVPRLIAQAYKDAYDHVFPDSTCGLPVFLSQNIIWDLDVERAAAEALKTMARKWQTLAFADGLPGPQVIAWAPEVYATASEYLALTRAFTQVAWATRKAPPGFNLDQGVNKGPTPDIVGSELGDTDVYGPVSTPHSERHRVRRSRSRRLRQPGVRSPSRDRVTRRRSRRPGASRARSRWTPTCRAERSS